MNIKILFILSVLSIGAFAAGDDRGHSMVNEMQNMKRVYEKKQRVPNQVNDNKEEQNKVIELENSPIEMEVGTHPDIGPKY